jgi:multidrug resistance efflux pump
MSWSGRLGGKARYTGPTWTVPLEKLKVAIVERGALESAKNGDIICTVRSGTKGSTVATTIRWIIDAGVQVVKGDKLVELDDSGLVEQRKDQQIVVDKARADMLAAVEAYNITLSQNESDLQAKRIAVELARIDLKKYQKGEFPQLLKDVLGRIKVAESDLEQQRDRAAWAKRMLKKGYFSASQAEAEQSRLQSYELALSKLQEEQRVLVDPEYGLKMRTEADLGNKVKQAADELDRAKAQASAKEVQARIDRDTKKSIHQQGLDKLKEIEEEIKKCRLVAPQDGLVVYYVSDQARGGGGAQQAIVAQGEPVREGQKLMQIPDLAHMVVNVRVHEAWVSALHNEKSPTDKRTWQPSEIRIDAIPNRVFHGHVKTVDTVAGQQDWFASDVKLYKTMVSIDEAVEGLKPGMSAEVTILADESPTEVMVVPVQAIIGAISLGATPRCYVVGANGQPEPRDVVVGLSNQRFVEVKSGLAVGDNVVLNPAALLAEEGSKSGAEKEAEGQNSAGAGKGGSKTQK